MQKCTRAHIAIRFMMSGNKKAQLFDINPLSLRFLNVPQEGDNTVTDPQEIEEARCTFGSEELVSTLTKLAARHEASVGLFSLNIYAILLHYYTGENHFCIGLPIEIKGAAEFIHKAQVNISFVPFNFNRSSTFLSLLQHTSSFIESPQANSDFNDSYLSTPEIISVSDKMLSGALFMQRGNPEVPQHNQYAKNDFNAILGSGLCLEQETAKDLLRCTIRYKKGNFHRDLTRNFLVAYTHLFIDIVTDLEKIESITDIRNVHEYCPLAPEVFNRIVYDWNATDLPYAHQKTIHELFEEQTARTPNHIALVYQENRLTYSELNTKVNQLAHYIIEQYQIGLNSLVALLLDRSEKMIIGILAILKAEGAYVPLDPLSPPECISYILEDTKASLLITQTHHEHVLKSQRTHNAISILNIDNPSLLEIGQVQLFKNPTPRSSSEALAYVIYTSGTTGYPKGVMVKHRNVVNLQQYLHPTYNFDNQEVIVQLANYVFDASVEQIVLALLGGGTLVLVPPQLELDKDAFYSYLNHNKVTYIEGTPTLLSQYELNRVPTLKYIAFGGEFLSHKTFERVASKSQCKIINTYGPTEATITTTVALNEAGKTSIGRPVANARVYILDASLRVLPIGAIGELYIGGAGVTIGYLNQPKLTAERFIDNPFQTPEEKKQGKHDRLYKTGDLVRWLPSGNLEYIGRNDFQVKVRGYRIELGEIEIALQAYPGVKQAVVVASNGNHGHKILIGYYTADKQLNGNNILNSLSERLPQYMVPTQVIFLKKLPLTTTGKLDRKALPMPDRATDNIRTPPRNNTEQRILSLWARALGITEDQMGVHDDFFRLGGDSIIGIQLVSKLRQSLGINVSVKDIFHAKTIAALHDNILAKSTTNTKKVEMIQNEQGILSGTAPLLPIQEWFFTSNFKVAQHWNQSFIITAPALEVSKLEKCLVQLFHYHDAFRLRYKRNEANSHYEQYYDEQAAPVALKQLDITSLQKKEGTQAFNDNLQKVFTQWQQDFDLERGPTYCVAYLHGYEDGTSRIFFALHHLIIDTVSWRIITEDLKKLYQQEKLESKGTSYRQWANSLKFYAQTHTAEKKYWQKVIADYTPGALTQLVVSEGTANTTQVTLTKEVTYKLLRDVHRTYHTQINDVLLAALSYATAEVTQKPINHIVLEGHGREEIDNTVDLSHTVGWFTSMYPVRLEAADNLGTTIKTTKETLRMIPNKGIGFGVLLGYDPATLPRITFNYLGQLDINTQGNASQNLWCIANEKTGNPVDAQNYDRNILNITGYVIEGQLYFSVVSKLSEVQIARFVDSLKNHLERILEYTTAQPRSHLTASDIDNIISQEYLDTIQKDREVTSVFLANSLQQGFIYHALNQGNADDAYRIQFIWEYRNPIDVEALKGAWQYAQNRFASLRLRLLWGEELIQAIDKKGTADWRYIDISQQKNEAQQQRLREIQQKDRQEAYDFNGGYLFRIYLIKLQEDRYQCIFSHHHAMIDGWSSPQLLGYVHDTYLQLIENPSQFSPSTADIYESTQKYLQEHRGEDRSYWQQYIAQIKDSSELNGLIAPKYKHHPIRLGTYRQIQIQREQTLIIQGARYQKLKNFSEQKGITINTLLQYGWHKALSIYGNTSQTVVGTTVSGRNLPIDNIEQAVGLYINTLPLIVNHNHQQERTILEILQEMQANISEINSRSNISLAELQQGSERLFDSIVVYASYPDPAAGSNRKSLNIVFQGYVEKQDYPLGVIAYEEQNQVVFKLKYAGELFDPGIIQQLLQTIDNLLTQISENPKTKPQELNYINAVQRQQLIYDWNATDQTYPQDNTIHKLFEEQVAKTPGNVALVYKDQTLTYQTLNEKSNQLAALLRDKGISTDSLVAIAIERSVAMIIGILGILKAGGAYVPIDPATPDERFQYILDDTQVPVIVTDRKTRDRIPSLFIQTISLDEDWDLISAKPVENLAITSSATQLAYVIYTSGTTGTPKGVLVEHGGVCNLSKDLSKRYHITEDDVILQFANYVFDASVEQVVLSLLHGATLVLMPNQLWLSKQEFYQYLQEHRVTHIHATPTFLSQYDWSQISTLKRMVAGGDVFDTSCYQHVATANPDQIINEYGPTETTITSLTYCPKDNTIAIGKPIANTQAYVLDPDLKILPVGAIGELHIGGSGLSRGYLNQPALTAEKFIPNPFQTPKEKAQGKNDKIYKTGDLVRWLPDGNLDYIGRNDFQVKIRGYRIELEEIESVLTSYSGVQQSVVIAKNVGEGVNTYSKDIVLIGYYVASTSSSTEDIFTYLRSKLPDYMIPAHLVAMDSLPVNTSGKIDREALPAPNRTDDTQYTAPRNELERLVCSIYAEVLDVPAEKVGTLDDFFKLGGNSISAIRLASRLNQALGTNITVPIIFSHSQLQQLVHFVQGHTAESITIGRATFTKEEDRILSFAQDRLWFIEQYEQGTNAYHIPMVFKINQSADLGVLEKSLVSLVERHEILRTVIKSKADEGRSYQVVLGIDDVLPLIHRQALKDEDTLEQLLQKQANEYFDLSKTPPIRIHIYQCNNEKYLSIVIHHIAFDGWSFDVFMKELCAYYEYYLNPSKQLELPELTIQYSDFSFWQREYLSGERLEKQLNYWKQKLEGHQPLNLITDKPRPAEIHYEGATIHFDIDATTSSRLRELAQELNVSLFTVLLSGYYLMLKVYCNQDDIIVGTAFANRQHAQIENLIGFFVNSLPLRVQIDHTASLKDFIQQVSSEVLAGQINQDLPFEKLVEELDVKKDTSRHPLFQVMFGVQSFGASTDFHHVLEELNEADALYNVAQFDLTADIDDRAENLIGYFNYAVSLFKEATVRGFIETYKEILTQFAEMAGDTQTSHQTTLTQLRYVDQACYQQITQDWNQTAQHYPLDKTIHALFEEQTVKTPTDTAVVCGGRSLSYAAVNERSNQLAHYLRDIHHIQSEAPVVLLLDRSEYMLITILAVLKAGGAYVPIDPNYPDERILYILKDTGAPVILTNATYQKRLHTLLSSSSSTSNTVTLFSVDDPHTTPKLEECPKNNPAVASSSTSLAYIMYTSGTTGHPKGVMIEHSGIVNRVMWMNTQHPLNPTDKILHKTPYFFDISVWELMWGIIYGARVVLAKPDGHRDPSYIIELIDHESVTITHFVPSMLSAFLEALAYKSQRNISETVALLPSLRKIFCSGETLPLQYVQQCQHLLPNVKLYNLYGPTEASIEVLHYDCNQENIDKVLVGMPIANTQVFVLDSFLNVVPIGAIGELYIGGIPLARGYLNKPDLTAKSFIANPFQTPEEKELGENSRLYKTGDLMRWLSDGNLEYIGRNDSQIKIRGYRIELTEIEAILLDHPKISHAVVSVYEPSESTSNIKFLIGYYVSDQELPQEGILNTLRTLLPEYMVPAQLIYLKQLPLRATGKLDRSALPTPELLAETKTYMAPRSELEQKLCMIWSEVLEIPVEKLGIQDDFFSLGGNSMTAIRLVTRIRAQISQAITLASLFRHSRVDALAQSLEGTDQNAYSNKGRKWTF